jgi:hypothetical protein
VVLSDIRTGWTSYKEDVLSVRNVRKEGLGGHPRTMSEMSGVSGMSGRVDERPFLAFHLVVSIQIHSVSPSTQVANCPSGSLSNALLKAFR